MNQHQNSERHHTTSKTNSFRFEDAYVNLAYENNSDSPDHTQQNSDDPQMNKIQEMGSVLTNNGKHKIHCLTIIGQIEGHYVLPSQNKTTKYEHIIPQLVAIEEDPEIEGLLILLNTVGGDVEAGLALAELFAGMKKTDGFSCTGRGSFYWCSSCGSGTKIVYCAVCNYDDTSCTYERFNIGRSADI